MRTNGVTKLDAARYAKQYKASNQRAPRTLVLLLAQRLKQGAEDTLLVLQLVVGADLSDGTVVDNHDPIHAGKHGQLVGHQHARLAPHELEEATIEDGFTNVSIHGCQRVVGKHDLRVRVRGTSQRHAGFLPAAEVDAAFADLDSTQT